MQNPRRESRKGPVRRGRRRRSLFDRLLAPRDPRRGRDDLLDPKITGSLLPR